MIKTFKYRLVPTRKQQAVLQHTLDLCRNLYNCALEQRKMQRIGQFAQMRQVTDARAEFPEYKETHVHVLQNVVKKLDRAFQGFFRRIKSGQKAGFPRFKGKDRFDSFAFNNTGFKLAGRYLQLSKIGAVKLRLSRPLPEGSVVKSLVVKRNGSNWYACLAVEFSPVHLPHSNAQVGIDVGVVQYATFSDGSTPIENPRFYESAQAELRRSQRRVARRKKGSHRRRKAVALLRKLHERITNKRNDFLHKQTTALIRKYGTIGVENLNIAGMVQGNCSKQILDASWGTWLRMLVFKAEEEAYSLDKRTGSSHRVGRAQLPRGLTWEPIQLPAGNARPSRQEAGPMTVGIGCICGQKNKPGAIQIGMDVRMTQVAGNKIHAKHDLTSKLFDLPLGFWGIVAGTFPQCERFISFTADYLGIALLAVENKVIEQIELDHITKSVTNANHKMRLEMFENELVSQFGMTRNEWLDRCPKDPLLKKEGRALAGQVEPDVYAIIAGFIRSSPVLLRICGKNLVEEIVSHTAIGIPSASTSVYKRMAFRTQSPYCSIQRTALAMSESLRAARKSSRKYVGPSANVLVIQPDRLLQFAPESPLLKQWSRTVTKSGTESLDSEERWKEFEPLLMPSASRT